MIGVTVEGVHYLSKRAACKAYGHSLEKIAMRVKNHNMGFEEAILFKGFDRTGVGGQPTHRVCLENYYGDSFALQGLSIKWK
jgi:hypothetical protein